MRVTQLFLSFVLILIPLAIACAAYLIIAGLKSKALISGSDVAATKTGAQASQSNFESAVSSASLSALPVESRERT
jgi:hypothetical protein